MKTTVQAEITIARPPEAVTEVILDSTKAALWTSDRSVLRWSPGPREK
jgi:uncharacterized protein YndB with AHSA1/START domain